MGEMEPRGAEEIIQRLREHELALDRRVEEARSRAREILAGARAEAERLKEEAKVELAQEVEALRREKAREMEAALLAAREETAVKMETLRRRAEANRERALAFLLLRVTGRAT